MIYVLYGTENVLIKEFINNIKNREGIDNIINYNLEDISLSEIIEDASYTSLFNDKKLIVVNNSIFLNSSFDTSSLEKYIKNINEATFLVFVLNEEKISSNLKIVKLLKKECVVREFNELSTYKLESIIVDNFNEEKYKIDKTAVSELIVRCNSDYSLIYSEIEKLKLYKLKDKFISYDDVCDVVNKNIESDIFKLTDAIGEKNKIKIMNVYNDLIENDYDPIMLIGVISNEFRLYKQVKDLISIGYSEGMISKHLKVHPYRVKLAIEKTSYYKKEDIENILSNLFKTDYDIKSGNIEKYIGLELLLLSL